MISLQYSRIVVRRGSYTGYTDSENLGAAKIPKSNRGSLVAVLRRDDSR